jgi:hypothetical protein
VFTLALSEINSGFYRKLFYDAGENPDTIRPGRCSDVSMNPRVAQTFCGAWRLECASLSTKCRGRGESLRDIRQSNV